jgi:HlyD family secretion protein
VLEVIDLTDVYMTVFLPETVAGRLAVGGEARLVLDAGPAYVIPARVSYVASDAQFTPKTVETPNERQKLVFEVKLQLDASLLEKYGPLVKVGLPGVAYVRVRQDAEWPANLAIRLPPAPPAAETQR